MGVGLCFSISRPAVPWRAAACFSAGRRPPLVGRPFLCWAAPRWSVARRLLVGRPFLCWSAPPLLAVRPSLGRPPASLGRPSVSWSSVCLLVGRLPLGRPSVSWSAARLLVGRPSLGRPPASWSSVRLLVGRPSLGRPSVSWSSVRLLVGRPPLLVAHSPPPGLPPAREKPLPFWPAGRSSPRSVG